jgi:hypothetical protein
LHKFLSELPRHPSTRKNLFENLLSRQIESNDLKVSCGRVEMEDRKKVDGKIYGDKQSHLWGPEKREIEHFLFLGFKGSKKRGKSIGEGK